MNLTEDQKVAIFAAALQGVVAKSAERTVPVPPGVLVKEAVAIAKEAIAACGVQSSAPSPLYLRM